MTSFGAPPFPVSPIEVQRWNTTRQRRRLLCGMWGQDIQGRVLSYFGEVRSAVIGKACRSMNLFDRLCSALATCYDETPKLWHGSSQDFPLFLGTDGLVARTGHWELMRDVQRYVVGCREELVRADWNQRDGLHVRRIHADAVIAEAWASKPDVPHTVMELRWLDEQQGWFWELLSIKDPLNPEYRIYDARIGGSPGHSFHMRSGVALGLDRTKQLLGRDYSGNGYPYRWTQGPRRGRPFLPLGTYHAQRTGSLWAAQQQQEAVEATLDLATAWTFFMHCLFRASWPQRVLLNGDVAGGVSATPTANGKQALTVEHVTDPTTLMRVVSRNPAHPATAYQWGPGANLQEMADAIGKFEAAVSNYDGLDAGHVVRRTSNDAQSAASLSIQREGRRQAQRVYAGQQRRVDLELVERMGALSNLAGLTPRPVPEFGYRLQYVALPLSPEELKGRREHNQELIDQGRMSIVDATMDENPGFSREEAIAHLQRIAEDNSQFRTVAPAAQAA